MKPLCGVAVSRIQKKQMKLSLLAKSVRLLSSILTFVHINEVFNRFLFSILLLYSCLSDGLPIDHSGDCCVFSFVINHRTSFLDPLNKRHGNSNSLLTVLKHQADWFHYKQFSKLCKFKTPQLANFNMNKPSFNFRIFTIFESYFKLGHFGLGRSPNVNSCKLFHRTLIVRMPFLLASQQYQRTYSYSRNQTKLDSTGNSTLLSLLRLMWRAAARPVSRLSYKFQLA